MTTSPVSSRGPRHALWTPLPAPCRADDVLLVRAYVSELVPWARGVEAAWLDPVERARRDGFLREQDREAFLARRCLLRAVLAERLRTEPAAVPLGPAPGAAGRRGRPGVPGLHFSLSSSGGHVLLATGPRELGIDVEAVPDLAGAEQMSRVLHPAERRRLAWTRRGRRPAAAARVWARKESLLKAMGAGLSRDPAVDRVGAGRSPRNPLPGWRILDLPLGPGGADARAALTVSEPWTDRRARG
ncbi:4'-phosphopantetheinyl transferase family protein [Kocuria sp. NPDC057446]|uniref:4'-phosphopantetheinyl transferase family protein n=1 Tax=Kocuria sp. NPDC057446 TaxID=3346137 RepID=UPI0036849E1A